jgi:hypothetical protein
LGSAEQEAEGLRAYREWRARRDLRIEGGGAPRFRIKLAERAGRTAEAGFIPVETVTLPVPAGRPGGRKFGRVVHEILQRVENLEEIPGLAAVWGRRHGANEQERDAAADAARMALTVLAPPAGATRYRELPVMVRLEDGTLVDGRIDCAWTDGERWTVIDYKTDRRETRSPGQLQLYGLALQRATGLPVRGIVLEI